MEKIVEVMGDSASQNADGFQSLRMDKLFLQFLLEPFLLALFRHVAHDDDEDRRVVDSSNGNGEINIHIRVVWQFQFGVLEETECLRVWIIQQFFFDLLSWQRFQFFIEDDVRVLLA